MSFFRITESGPPITNADIIAFEIEFNLQLPQLYKDFLILYNGGVIDGAEAKFRSPASDAPSTLMGFYPLLLRNNRSMRPELRSYVDEIEGMLPIAYDYAAYQICLGIGANASGIYHYCPAYDSPEGEEDQLYKLADSFEDFCESLIQE